MAFNPGTAGYDESRDRRNRRRIERKQAIAGGLGGLGNIFAVLAQLNQQRQAQANQQANAAAMNQFTQGIMGGQSAQQALAAVPQPGQAPGAGQNALNALTFQTGPGQVTPGAFERLQGFALSNYQAQQEYQQRQPLISSQIDRNRAAAAKDYASINPPPADPNKDITLGRELLRSAELMERGGDPSGTLQLLYAGGSDETKAALAPLMEGRSIGKDRAEDAAILRRIGRSILDKYDTKDKSNPYSPPPPTMGKEYAQEMSRRASPSLTPPPRRDPSQPALGSDIPPDRVIEVNGVQMDKDRILDRADEILREQGVSPERALQMAAEELGGSAQIRGRFGPIDENRVDTSNRTELGPEATGFYSRQKGRERYDTASEEIGWALLPPEKRYGRRGRLGEPELIDALAERLNAFGNQ